MGSRSNDTTRSRTGSGLRKSGYVSLRIEPVLRGSNRVVLRARPRVAVVGVERRSAQTQREARRRRLGQVLDLEAQRDGGVVAQDADVAEVDVLGEANHAPGARMAEQQQRQADAREEDEEDGREEEDGDREQAGGRQESAPDDAPAAQDSRHVDRETRAVARALAVVALDLAPQMAEHERAGSDDEEPEEAEPVREAAAQDGARHEVEQRQDDDLLVVRRAAPRGEADDLQERRELDRDVEREAAGEQAPALDRQENERRGRREVAHRRAALLALGDRDGDGESDQEDDVGPEAQRCGADDGEHAQHREGVGHDPVDQAEPHSAALRGRGSDGVVTGSSSAR